MVKNMDDKKLSSSVNETHQVNNNIMATAMEIHRGPLPSPEVLERYEQICSGSAERIISMAEKEASERHKANERAFLRESIGKSSESKNK